MPRVKRGTIKSKRRRTVLSRTKGYRFGRKSKKKLAREAIVHAGTHAFRDRKTKKRLFRRLWQTRINAAVRSLGMSYSQFVGQMKKKDIEVDRKILAEIAETRPELFEKVVEEVKK